MTAPSDRLTRRLAHAIAQRFGVRFSIEEADSDSWASATFAGTTHHLVVKLGDAGAEKDAERIADTIADAEFELRGHVIADLAITTRARCDDGVMLTIDALTIVDA